MSLSPESSAGSEAAVVERDGGSAALPSRVVEDLLYLGCQGRLLEAVVREMSGSGQLGAAFADFGMDMRAMAIARAMRSSADGRGDLCHPGLLSPGPALAFGATPLEFLRHVTARGTSPASARAGGLSWHDTDRGLIGWGGPRGGTMTQVMAGAALAHRQRGENRVALVFEERGALQGGGWHEGMNLSGALALALIVVVEDSFPPDSADATDLRAVAGFYGADFVSVGAMELVELYRVSADARQRALGGDGPVIVELRPLPDEERWALHDGLAEAAVADGTISERERIDTEAAATASVQHASERLGKEPGPSPEEALAPICAAAPPTAPWPRLDPPSPRTRPVEDLQGAAR